MHEKHLKEFEFERCLREHPPRDFQREKETEVYQGYVGYIEIRVTGASLASTTTMAIPKELTELGLETDLRAKLSEKMRIDLSDKVDLGASDVNERVEAFREIFTRKMGPPLGRIYKKSDWEVMQAKWAEIEHLVKAANEKIRHSLHQAVKKTIVDAAGDWANAVARNPSRDNRRSYTKDEILDLLNAQSDRKHRATAVNPDYPGLFMKREAASALVTLARCPIYRFSIRRLLRRTIPWVNPILAPVRSVSMDPSTSKPLTRA